ncbi:thiamine ABC transporter permease [Fusarium heterosporum]|uniref:Thiamine ABC transporter permease n=1 Tax=Fusarium heterosporum TaxID=42747 RepID=A0A8H5WEQ5_FUSHE|nr:thiamine ABC transporter permease [Fusarium heterosporum]
MVKITSTCSLEVGKLITFLLVLRSAVYNGGKPGSVLAFNFYWVNVINTLNFFAGIQTRLTQGLTAARQLRTILEIKSTIVYGCHELQLDNGKIQMKDVSFHHHKEENGDKRHVLKNFSVEFAAGTTTAIIGPSGCGKSTIVGSIAKVHQIQKGSITFDDQNTNTLKRGEVPKHVAYLEQKTAIFDGTFAENIAYGYPGASHNDIQAAAKKARIHDSIMERSGEYGANVGENGSNLSGGENQRLGVARLFMTNKPIIIIDEATSAQDAVTQSQIDESLEEHCRDKTVIKIAHRLSTIKGADKIIRLEKDEDGCARIAEQGTHDELMEQGGGLQLRRQEDPKVPANENYCVETWFYIGSSEDCEVRTKTLLHEPAFNQLRTKEQLGYLIFSGNRAFPTTYDFRSLIQSEMIPHFSGARLEALLRRHADTLDNMSNRESQAKLECGMFGKDQ